MKPHGHKRRRCPQNRIQRTRNGWIADGDFVPEFMNVDGIVVHIIVNGLTDNGGIAVMAEIQADLTDDQGRRITEEAFRRLGFLKPFSDN